MNFKDAAKAYYQQWKLIEEPVFNIKPSPITPGWLDKVVKIFTLSRRFPGNGPARMSLITAATHLASIVGVPKVADVDNLAGRIGSGNELSAASKFCWMIGGTDLPIYDSRAKTALYFVRWNSFNSRRAIPAIFHREYATYADYVVAWEFAYDLVNKRVVKACHTLNPGVIVEAGQPWFHRRTFDIWLWHIGGSFS